MSNIERLNRWKQTRAKELQAVLAALPSTDNRKYKPIPDLLIHERMVKRFHSKYAQADGCWMWNGLMTQGGYAAFRMGHRVYLASRVAFRLATGIDPGPSCVCHQCDNPKCVNPSHLFLGTHTDNMRDARRKGRVNPAKGIGHGCCKLTEQQVLEIRGLLGQMSQRAIGIKFGISQRNVFDILKRNIWRHLL